MSGLLWQTAGTVLCDSRHRPASRHLPRAILQAPLATPQDGKPLHAAESITSSPSGSSRAGDGVPGFIRYGWTASTMYRTTLRAHSGPSCRLSSGVHRGAEREVLNETATCTAISIARKEAEFLYPASGAPSSGSAARDRLSAPSRRSGPPHHGCRRNAGSGRRKPGRVHPAEQRHSAQKRRDGEFGKLRDDEVTLIEAVVNDTSQANFRSARRARTTLLALAPGRPLCSLQLHTW